MSETTEKSDQNSDGDDLSELLKSALRDFDEDENKPVETVSVSKNTAVADTTVPIVLPSDVSGTVKEPDFLHKLQQLMDSASPDADLLNQMQELMNESQSLGATDCSDDAIAQAIDSLAGAGTDAMGDSAFADMMADAAAGGVLPMVDQMFRKVLSKEVLYPSLVSVRDQYPEWLAKNSSKTDPAEVERFTKQYGVISKMCLIFEAENENDAMDVKEKKLADLMELMNAMTELGHPPKDFSNSLNMASMNPFAGDASEPTNCNTM